jgi:predicted TIM-barrel fold metal-dependent hydrolase
MHIIDAHLHVNYAGFNLKALISYLDKEKIDCCWLLTWEEINPGLWPYQFLSIEDVYESYLKYPSRIVPFYAPDPHRIDATKLLDYWYKKGIRGCGELKATTSWDSDGIKNVLQTVQRLKLPVIFHMEESGYRNIPYSNALYDKLIFYLAKTKRKSLQIPQSVLLVLMNNFTPLRNRKKSYFFPGYMMDFASLEVILRDYPDINLVAHGPTFWKYMSNDVSEQTEMLPRGKVRGEGIIWRLLRDYPNLYADISYASGLNALKRDYQNAKIFL